MDKDYLIEEMIEGLSELAPFSKTLVIQSANKNDNETLKTLNEAELIVEHLASCIVALKKAI
jgi:hypothetical protein